MKKAILTGTLILTLIVCSAQRKENIYAHFGNLVGTWVMNTPDASLFEEWKILNDSTLEGKAWKVEKEKKTMLEDVLLIWSNGKYHYEPKAYGQNNEQRVIFTQSELSTTKEMVSGTEAHNMVSIVFSNVSHDYPQYISYSIGPDAVVAKVGNDATFGDSQVYKYARLKE